MINLEAINKLNGELKDARGQYAKLIVAHLVKRIKEDSGLGDDVAKENKSLEGCMVYIKDQAKKQATGGVAVIEDATVYEWAEDYYRSEEAPPQPKPASKPVTKSPAKPKQKKPTPVPAVSQVSLFDDDIIDETDDLWLF